MIVVAGPPRAGVSSLVAALRERVSGHEVVEAAEVDGAAGSSAVAVLVLVASAAAELTESDCTVLSRVDEALEAGDVVCVLAKVDAHRRWRDVLAADRELLTDWVPALRDVPWVTAAAAPDVGSPQLDELVELLAKPRRLHASTGGRAERLRAEGLRSERAQVVREHRSARSGRAIALRAGLHRERDQLGRYVRQRCADLRAEFRTAAAELTPGSARTFEAAVRRAADALARDVEQHVADRLDGLAADLGLTQPPPTPAGAGPSVPDPTAAPGAAERALTVALGAGFGLGVGMAMGRLLAGLAPAMSGTATALGALAGLALTLWLVGTRAVLQRRQLYERWVTEAVAALRWHLDDRLAAVVMSAETHFAVASAARDEAAAEEAARRIAAIDARISESFL